MIEWINDNLENVEEAEKKEREMLKITNIILENTLLTRDKIGKTSSIELKHQKVEHKDIEKQILSNTDLVQIQILHSNLSAINMHIETLVGINSYIHRYVLD